MIEIQYGILKNVHIPKQFGIIGNIANVKIGYNGQIEEDAALILSRRSFGIGRSHLILRQNLHGILNTETLITMAIEACCALYGHFMSDVAHKIADIILDYTDEVVLHPPEDQMIELKQKEKLIEQSGLVLRLNDEVLLDAR